MKFRRPVRQYLIVINAVLTRSCETSVETWQDLSRCNHQYSIHDAEVLSERPFSHESNPLKRYMLLRGTDPVKNQSPPNAHFPNLLDDALRTKYLQTKYRSISLRYWGRTCGACMYSA